MKNSKQTIRALILQVFRVALKWLSAILQKDTPSFGVLMIVVETANMLLQTLP